MARSLGDCRHFMGICSYSRNTCIPNYGSSRTGIHSMNSIPFVLFLLPRVSHLIMQVRNTAVLSRTRCSDTVYPSHTCRVPPVCLLIPSSLSLLVPFLQMPSEVMCKCPAWLGLVLTTLFPFLILVLLRPSLPRQIAASAMFTAVAAVRAKYIVILAYPWPHQWTTYTAMRFLQRPLDAS